MATQNGVGRDLLAAGMGMVGSIVVAAITVLPQMRKGDADRIAALNAQMERLCRSYGCDGASRSAWTVRGSVRPSDPGAQAADYQVFLVSERQVVTTADDGSFAFENVPPGLYSVVARQAGTDPSHTLRGLLNRQQRGDSLVLRGARLDYMLVEAPRTNEAAGAPEEAALTLYGRP